MILPSSDMKEEGKNCSTKSQINALPVGWGIRKIHTKINFKWLIISEKSWFPQNEYISKPDKGIIATLNKEVGATSCRYSVELTRETIGYQIMMAF